MLIRYFAGAAEAAGVTEETIETGAPVGVDDLVESLGAGRERLSRVLAVSALLVDGRIARAEDVIAPGARVDVLPPFAGG